nr:MAG TPA: hypothetical protein [Caudoviricetes sp.]
MIRGCLSARCFCLKVSESILANLLEMGAKRKLWWASDHKRLEMMITER